MTSEENIHGALVVLKDQIHVYHDRSNKLRQLIPHIKTYDDKYHLVLDRLKERLDTGRHLIISDEKVKYWRTDVTAYLDSCLMILNDIIEKSEWIDHEEEKDEELATLIDKKTHDLTSQILHPNGKRAIEELHRYVKGSINILHDMIKLAIKIKKKAKIQIKEIKEIKNELKWVEIQRHDKKGTIGIHEALRILRKDAGQVIDRTTNNVINGSNHLDNAVKEFRNVSLTSFKMFKAEKKEAHEIQLLHSLDHKMSHALNHINRHLAA
jgi:hypothetical protein